MVLVLFLLFPIAYAKEQKIDLIAYCFIATIIAIIVTSAVFPVNPDQYVQFILFQPLIYIVSMNIIVLVMARHRFFRFIAAKVIQATHGNPHAFFYLICILSTFTSAVMEDISAAIIYIPLILQVCKILKVRVEPYVYSISICLNIGDMFAPFSNSQNLVISSAFNLDFAWFAQGVVPAVILLMFFTIYMIDVTMLKEYRKPTKEEQVEIEKVLAPLLKIEDPRHFKGTGIIFASIIVGLLIVPQAYIVALVGAVVIALYNRVPLIKKFQKVDWKLPLVFVSLFLIIGCMRLNGSIQWLEGLVQGIMVNNVLGAALIILVISSVATSFLMPNPTTVIFIPIFASIFIAFPVVGAHPDLLFIAFILGVNVGGNFIPDGAPCYMEAISLADQYHIPTINYKSMTKMGAIFSLLHIGVCALYLFVYALLTGLF